MRSREQGFTIIEFAVVGVVFFSLLFGVIETGRWLFAINTLTEATRRGARYAAMCKNLGKIQSVTITSSLLSDLTTDNVEVDYWNSETNKYSSNRTDADEGGAARVRIRDYSITLNIPFFTLTVPLPDCATMVPFEVPAGSFCP